MFTLLINIAEEFIMPSQVYPWRRYWARIFNITFIMPIYIFIIALFSPGLNYTITRMDNFIGGILLLLFYLIFFEPMMLSSFGTTPGKALLGIKIRALSGKKISYITGMKRGSLLWLNGIGMGISYRGECFYPRQNGLPDCCYPN